MEPLTHVTVENFQSIGEASLDLGAFTVIVGRGNMGKSALLRAIGACLFNDAGADCIRQGTKKTSVTLTLGAEHTVTWARDDKTARYDVNVPDMSPTYTKLAGGIPSELQSLFGIRTIEIDKTFSIRPQVHGQFDSPLLLTESSGKAARALAKLTKLEVVVTAQMAAARDLRREKQNATAREREVAELEARIAEFPDMDRLDAGLGAARELLEAADKRLNVLADAEDAYLDLTAAKARLTQAPPSARELDGLMTRVDKLQNMVLAHKVVSLAKEALPYTRAAIADTASVVTNAQTELDAFMSELGTCPLCGGPMTGDHVDV